MLVDLGSLAAKTCFGPLSDITLDVGPYKSGTNQALSGFDAWAELFENQLYIGV